MKERRERRRRPLVPPSVPTGLNKERPGQTSKAEVGGEPIVSDALSGNPHPGNGQVVGMVNACESVIKTVMAKEPKWVAVSGSGQNGGSSRNVGDFLRSPREVADRTNSQLVVVEFSADS